MLQIKDIHKEYKTGNLVQKALDGVSLNLRDNEFVAILGPSGSGKTTLLNIIGGLDRYDSGDLIINGVSTKRYKDRDWDSYRNHTIGFVFQSYNLIPHQTVLSNVELALTISGISRKERKQRALDALEKVGLREQAHKKPNQMSGGQMQRVAIARALVNDPDILLADEPTGALDTDTSIQVMDLLKEVAKDRLVVMVTHNPELAEEYATRIVKLRDGRITDDSDPFKPEENADTLNPVHKNLGKASMSFLTALALSFNNLWTKKTRTILVAFAGSIGIIGIALILSLSNGVNTYIDRIEAQTLSQYPLSIESSSISFMSMMMVSTETWEPAKEGEVTEVPSVSQILSTVRTNDLVSLKEYFDSGKTNIYELVNGIEYSYNLDPQIFYYNRGTGDYRQVNPNNDFASMGLTSSSVFSSSYSMNVFFEMPENESLYINQYNIKAGRWPENSQEAVLVLTQNGAVTDYIIYAFGLRDTEELDRMIRDFSNGIEVVTDQEYYTWHYEDFMGTTFKVIPAYEFYNRRTSYRSFIEKIEQTARAFWSAGIRPGDAVTICLPNIPQTVECFYALNRIGAVANMIHPQSAQNEITYYLNLSESKAIVTVDLFCETVQNAIDNADHPVKEIVCRMQEGLPFFLSVAYFIKKGRDYLQYPNIDYGMLYKDFLKGADTVDFVGIEPFEEDRTSVILYSGGTSGFPKGTCLTDFNFNALAMQGFEALNFDAKRGMRLLSCMPMFHGFGLGINIHVGLVFGALCMLMPTFNKHTYAKALLQKKPNFIAGVPTIFEALLHLPELEGKDLSYLFGMFCGGDSLSVELKRKIDTFLHEHNAPIQVREGYGLTECVTASCLTPTNEYRENSIGLPFPDMVYQIVRPDTDDVLPYGEEGEIILRGPTLMKGYLKNPEETAKTLRRLADGNIWLYTGDLGSMDEDGYVYFKQRIKRMIITNGYNV